MVDLCLDLQSRHLLLKYGQLEKLVILSNGMENIISSHTVNLRKSAEQYMRAAETPRSVREARQ